MNLFSFLFKPSLDNSIYVDIHSHLLPGIDDGVKSLTDSINIIKRLKELGYKKLITTPHIKTDFYPNTKEIITEKLNSVKSILKEQNIEIILEASAEYYLTAEFLTLLEDNELLPFMDHYILFETPCNLRPLFLEETIERIYQKGYIPVLAHPERYKYLRGDMRLYRALKAQGVLFQVNLKSLESKSKYIKETALKLLQSGLVDFTGSDAHNLRDVSKIQKVLQNRKYQNIIKKNKLLNNDLFISKK